MRGIYRTAAGQRLVEERYRRLLREWPIENEQFHVPTRQGETFVVACGKQDGRLPLILLHGALANSGSWMGDVAEWASRFRIYAIDVIGEPGLSASSRPPLATDAYAMWLDDVISSLGLDQVALAGVSLGGWLALDYAVRRAGKVDRLALVCPGGVGRQRTGILFKIASLSLFGSWGKRKLIEAVLGRVEESDVSPALREFGELFELIQKHAHPRRERLPVFSDEALGGLNMPVLAIVGAKDALLDSLETRRRIEEFVEKGEVRWLDDAGHFIPRQGEVIGEFLSRCFHGAFTVNR